MGPDPNRSALSKTPQTTSEVTRRRLAFVRVLASEPFRRFKRLQNLSIANRGQNMRLDLPIEQ
jgi:hypothetical protein